MEEGGQGPQERAGGGSGEGRECITNEFWKSNRIRLPTHSSNLFILLLFSKFLFSEEKENATRHPFCKRIGALVSHAGGKCHPQGPTSACLRRPAQPPWGYTCGVPPAWQNWGGNWVPVVEP